MANKLSDEDILKLAKLSKLVLTNHEIEELKVELNSILDFVSQLDEIDVDDLLPTNQVTGLKNVTRPDQPIDYQYSASLLANANQVQDNYLVVPKVLNEN
jgi:aspartyl-tRNA(Asn)/glutamyl-tRNA(Gln) amidotransferase subunit C